MALWAYDFAGAAEHVGAALAIVERAEDGLLHETSQTALADLIGLQMEILG